MTSLLNSAYLDMAEVQAQRHIPMTMADWEERLNGFLTLWDREILKDAGKISAELAKIHAETESLFRTDCMKVILTGLCLKIKAK